MFAGLLATLHLWWVLHLSKQDWSLQSLIVPPTNLRVAGVPSGDPCDLAAAVRSASTPGT